MKKLVIVLAGVMLSLSIPAQNFENPDMTDKNPFRVMFYNVENLFDLDDDSLTRDEEYLPGGLRGWSYTRYRQKLINIGRVLVAGGWNPPAIVGLCEIESRKVLTDLTRYSPVNSLDYRFIHYESPDARGIDVALLYLPEYFRPVHHKPISVSYPHAPDSRTRDVLYVAGTVPTGDTLHCFVCHFPSRHGGELESEQNRKYVASVLRKEVDSVLTTNPESGILIMGDFNDYPDNASMKEVLKAYELNETEGELVNLMFPFHRSGKGTHKHAGEWGALDQLIVSRTLLNTTATFYTRQESVAVFSPTFLLEEDSKFFGWKPFRTYTGMKYQGGYSDHLPVIIDFYYK